LAGAAQPASLEGKALEGALISECLMFKNYCWEAKSFRAGQLILE